jgi:hypothetical protein
MIAGILFVIVSLVLGVRVARRINNDWEYLEFSCAAVTAGFSLSTIVVYGAALVTKNLAVATIIAIILLGVLLGIDLWFYKDKKTIRLPKHSDIIVFGFLLVIIVAFFAVCIMESSSDGVVITMRSWGDNLLHVSIANSFARSDNFPPEYPNYSGFSMNYYFMADFLSAIFLRENYSLQFSFIFVPILFTVSIFYLIYAISRREYGIRAGVFAVILLLLFSSIGFFAFYHDYTTSTTSEQKFNFLTRTTYSLDFERQLYKPDLLEIMGSQRPLAPGFAIAALIVFILLSIKQLDKKTAVILGILTGVLPFYHVHIFIYVFIISMLYFLWNRKKEAFYFFIPATVIGALKIIGVTRLAGDNHFISWHIGWLVDKVSLIEVVKFWGVNWGPIVVLGVISYWFMPKNKRWIWWGLPIMLFFVNFIQWQPFLWDNHKFIDAAVLFSLPAIGKIFSTVWGKKVWGKPLVIIVVLFLTLTGVHSFFVAFNARFVLLTNEDLAVGNWVDKVLPKDARVLTISNNNPVNMVAGRKIYMGYEGQVWSHGFPDFGDRENKIEQLKKVATVSGFCSIWPSMNINYVFIGPNERSQGFNEKLLVEQGWKIESFLYKQNEYDIYAPSCTV